MRHYGYSLALGLLLLTPTLHYAEEREVRAEPTTYRGCSMLETNQQLEVIREEYPDAAGVLELPKGWGACWATDLSPAGGCRCFVNALGVTTLCEDCVPLWNDKRVKSTSTPCCPVGCQVCAEPVNASESSCLICKKRLAECIQDPQIPERVCRSITVVCEVFGCN